jgi:hypothetical protein
MKQPAKRPALTPVESTAVKAYHYDQGTKKFTVEFKSGRTWEYDDVSLERATAFEGSMSKGRYFGDQIKPNHIGREVFD